MNKFPIILLVLIFFSCKNNKDKIDISESFTTDTSANVYTEKPDFNTVPFGSGLFDEEKEEREKRRTLLFISIDSTYSAIRQIETIKREMTNQSAINLSMVERNLKSKALLKLNLLENELARQVDSSLLLNLKLHTNQLNQINQQISLKSDHLQELSEKLARAGAIMSRVTDVLGACISKGIIKPATPPALTPAAVKAAN